MQVLVSQNEACLGLSGADREEKRNDSFYTDLRLPPELRDVRVYINGTDCPVLYNFGPISTKTHHDGVGGWSQLVEGYKVFFWWEPQHSHLLHYNTDDHYFNLQAAKDVVSFRWALMGPGASISLPADLPHCVVSLTSSLLFTWATDNGPSRLCRLLGYVLAGIVRDPLWLYDWQHNKRGSEERWLPSRLYVVLLQRILQHTATRLRAWQESGQTFKVRATAKAWQQARADGMDDAFSRPFHPVANTELSNAEAATIRDMYRETNSCMQQWALDGSVRLDTDTLMPTVNGRHAKRRQTAP